jgi:hypothetical protein|tara:strand:- start:91 stop:537 length:447 start_codon:yes stop_codon:yes gene_type:complete
MNQTQRLTKDKKKSQDSYQSKLSPSEIKEKLEEYKIVTDINSVALNSHLRYFTTDKKTKEKLFRLGGFLTKIDKEKGYLILSSGKFTWSVQLEGTTFFQKMTFKEFKKEIESELKEKYKSKINKLEEENNKLKDTLKEIKHEIKKNKK